VRLKDSSLISFALSGSNGSFEIRNLDEGEYNLLASFTGLRTGKKTFSIAASRTEVDLGLIRMDRSNNMLDEVVITEAPVRINGDTIAYRADAFKTKPNATVEDLLKKLPGVQVERDGTVKAQGENVQKVYVDGKEFFSNDPKLATKNLTADMVDQVEVYDDMSEQAKFSRIDDGSRSKAINLKLKKDKKKGLFGRAYAGAGRPGERYDAGVSANMFKGATQTSVIARTNNNNDVGFTPTDFIGAMGMGGLGGGMMGGGGRGGGGMGMTVVGGAMGAMGGMGGTGGTMGGGSSSGFGNNGITRSTQAGINYRDTWSKLFDVNGSYFFNQLSTVNDRNSFRTTNLKDFVEYRDGYTTSRTMNDNHRFNMNLIYSIDSFNSIIYNPNLNLQRTYDTYSMDSLLQYREFPGNPRYLANRNVSATQSEGNGYNLVNSLIWRHKFRRAGRTLSVNFNNTLNESDRNVQALFRGRTFNTSGTPVYDSTSNVLNKTTTNVQNYSAGASYTEPIAYDKILEFNYTFTRNGSESDRQVLKFDPVAGKHSIKLDSLSNNFESFNTSNRLGTNLRIVKKKYNYQLGFAVQQTTLEGNNLSKGTQVRQTFTNLFPTASFNYQFGRSRNLRFNYRGNTRQPSVTQLQDVTDVTNPLNVYIGNPRLGQEFTNTFSLSYNFFDVIRFRNLFALINFSNTNNKISNSIQQLPTGQQITRPVNLDGAFNVSGIFNLGFPIKKLQGGNFNTNSRVMYFRDVNLIQGEQSFTNNLTLGEDLRLSYNYKERLDLGIGVSTNYTSVRYTNSVMARNNNSFFTHVFSGDVTYTFPMGLIVATDFDYTMNTGRSDGFNQNIALWNASVAKELFKNKKGEIRLSVNDLLNRNASVNRNAQLNYIEDVRNLALTRYFMFTFTYKLNRMGGRTMPRMVERATRGMRVQ
jgi:hypothetical protein